MARWLGTDLSTAGWVALGTVLIYVTTLAAVRLAGRRTVAQMSAFDYVVSIALGSVIATTAVSSEVSYLDGLITVVVLLLLQVALGALRKKNDFVRRVTGFEPEIMYENGELDLPSSPLSAQPTLEEVRSKVRQTGLSDWSKVDKIILEPDGNVSVLLKS